MSRTRDNKEVISTIEELGIELTEKDFIPKDMMYSSLLNFISMTLVDISQSLAIIADVMKGVEDEEEENDES